MSGRFSTVAVLKGGPGAEREVSLRSGAAVAAALRQSGLEVLELDVRDMAFSPPAGVEAVFPVLHGEFGEDGIAQRRLEELGLPYVGPRSWEMPRSFDKEITHALLASDGIPMADWEMVGPGQSVTLTPPLVLKAPRQGSSIGVEIVRTAAELPAALERVRRLDTRVLAECFVAGGECTVGFLGNDPLPIVKISPAGGDYDYEAKYNRSDTMYEAPAPYPDEWTKRIRAIAVDAYRVLGGRHLGRVDFRVDENGHAVVLEMNTIPGFTATSLLPKAAAAAGIEFPELCLRILDMAEAL